jgi:hypothetical protein
LSSGENYVTITNGSQFAEDIRRNSSVQPIAPVSGAPSTGMFCIMTYYLSIKLSFSKIGQL